MGCDVDSEMLTDAEADPVLTFLFQVLGQKSDISGSTKVKVTSSVFNADRATFLASKRASV